MYVHFDHQVIRASANNGSSALISRDGDLFIFGKDSGHSDYGTGKIQGDLKGVAVCEVGLGKAHAVVLAKSGEVFTFGMNNKGQCGRDFNSPSQQQPQPPPGNCFCSHFFSKFKK